MQIYTIVMYGAAALLLIALAATLGKAAWCAPRGPFRAVSASGAAVGLLLAISSLQHLLILAAHKGIIASHWLRLLLGPLAAAQATLAALVGIWALVLIVRHWNQLGRAQSMAHALTSAFRQRDSPGSAHLPGHGRNPCAAHPAEDRAA